MREIGIRAASGALYIAVVVAAILLGSYFYGALFLLFALGSMNEFYTLARRHTPYRPNAIVGLLAGVIFYVGVFVAVGHTSLPFFEALMFGAKFCALCIALLAFLLPAIQVFSKHPTPVQNWALTVLGWLYIMLPFTLAPVLPKLGNAETTWQLLLFPIIMVWINDTGAYCVGRLWGRHKLLERVTPSKTIEGFIGGVALTALSGLLFVRFVSVGSVCQWVGLGVLIALLSVLGDLVESQLKRSIDVKDSGRFLPGHGGFLDRFDSMLFALMGAAGFFILL